MRRLLTCAVVLLMFTSVSWALTGTGLTGKYYNDDPANTDKQFVTWVLDRVDPQINFDWGTSTAPAPGVWTDNFSIHWSGQIQPDFTGTYTFYITSDDGTVLRLNETIVADNYWPHGTVTKEGTFEMVAGRKYGIRLDYFEISGGANCKLEWSCAQQPRQVVPQSCLYPDYFTADLAYPQMGWAPGFRKLIALATSSPVAVPQYQVYSSAGQLVLSGAMADQGLWWGKYQYTADISPLIIEDVYTVYVDDYDWGTFPISQTAYQDIYYKGSHVSIPDMVNSFWAFQRSNPATYPDTGLPLVEVRALPEGGTEEVTIGVTGDVSGGWHDASSKDKSNIETAFSISNMCYALDRMTDSFDRTALINEMRWGTDYLLRVQNADGSFFSYMPDNPRRVYSNKSPGVAGECARALAAASVIYQSTDPTYAQQCRAAAESAWTWIEANPDNFQRGLVSSGWCGNAGNVLGAAVELARATGTQKYKDYATTQIQNGKYTDDAAWVSKTSTPFPGQLEGYFGGPDDTYTGKSVIALCRFYQIADASTKTTIADLCRQYITAVKKTTGNPYTAWSKVFYSWFGFNQNLLAVSDCLLHIGVLFNHTEAMDIGLRNFEWGTGLNPLGGSFAIGFGGDPIIPMFSRTPAQSIGGVMPGMLYIDGKLSTWYGRSWNIWTIGETGLGSSPVVDIMAMLTQYAAANTTAPAAPSNLTGTAWDNKIDLAWNSSFGAASYSVKRSTVNGSGYQTIATVSSVTFTDTNVAGGVTYYYVVSANNPYGSSGNSNQAAVQLAVNVALGKTATASSVQGSNTAAMAVDGNMSTRWESSFSDPQWWQVDLGATYTLSRFRICWEYAAAKAYNIQVSANGSSWTTVYQTDNGPGGTEVLTITPVNARYVKMNGITRKTQYGYSFWEFEVYGSGGGDTTPPAAPTGLAATAGNATVSLDWANNTETDLASYKVYRSTTSGSGYTVIASGLTSSAYTDNAVTNGTTYYYVVMAVDISSNESAASSEASALPQAPDTTPPAVPTGLTATAGNATVSLDWANNTEADLAGYRVKRATVSGGPYSTIATGVTVSAYTDNAVTNGTAYYYVVTAVDTNSNESASSSQVSATPQAPAIVTLLQDGFETDFNKWTDGGTTDWDRTTSYKYTGSYSAHAGSSDNDLISDNLNTAGYSSITIEFRYRDDDIDDGDNIYLQLYNGSSYANKFELGNSAEDTWHLCTVTINNSGTDVQYFRSNFRIKFEGTSIDTGENLWIDDVKVTVQ